VAGLAAWIFVRTVCAGRPAAGLLLQGGPSAPASAWDCMACWPPPAGCRKPSKLSQQIRATAQAVVLEPPPAVLRARETGISRWCGPSIHRGTIKGIDLRLDAEFPKKLSSNSWIRPFSTLASASTHLAESAARPALPCAGSPPHAFGDLDDQHSSAWGGQHYAQLVRLLGPLHNRFRSRRIRGCLRDPRSWPAGISTGQRKRRASAESGT